MMTSVRPTAQALIALALLCNCSTREADSRRAPLAAAFGADGANAAALTAPAPTTLWPASLQVTRGSASNQPLSVLNAQTESGTIDDWNAYKEFTPATGGFGAVVAYNVPPTVSLATLSSLVVNANYKGGQKSYQRWTWELYDNVGSKWVLVGDNANAAAWTWSALAFPAAAPLGRFVDASRQIKLRYQTVTAVDLSDLDYLALTLVASAAPAPLPPTPTPAPVVPPPPPPVATTWWKPTPGTTWQEQFTGVPIDLSFNVAVYSVDGEFVDQATVAQLHALGRKVICYIDGGSWETYRSDAGKFPASVLGTQVAGWPNERFLDIRQISVLWPIMQARIAVVKQKGCDGFYHDWAHVYKMNSGFPLTYQDEITYNLLFVNEGHRLGLSVGLINDLDQVTDLVADYDWAVNESCMDYNECALEVPFIKANKPVFALEYQSTPAALCPSLNNLNFDAIFKNVLLDAYRVACR